MSTQLDPIRENSQQPRGGGASPAHAGAAASAGRSATSLLIVILNFRTPGLTVDCLASLAACVHEVPGTSVVVVDNASGDDSLPRISSAIAERGWSSWCQLLPNPTNDGFAGGNNRGFEQIPLKYPTTEWVLFLNSDTLVPAGTLKHCVDVMRRDAGIGVMSCRLRNADGSVQNTARLFPNPLRQTVNAMGLPWQFPRAFSWANLEDPTWDRDTEARDVDWLGGAFLLCRRDLLDRIGCMDESFFFYGEDIEFSHRIMRAGFRRYYDPATWITHLGGASSDPTKLPAKQKSVYAWKSRYHLQRQCYGRLAALWLRSLDVMMYALRCLRLKLTGAAGRPEAETQFTILSLLTRPLRTPTTGAR